MDVGVTTQFYFKCLMRFPSSFSGGPFNSYISVSVLSGPPSPGVPWDSSGCRTAVGVSVSGLDPRRSGAGSSAVAGGGGSRDGSHDGRGSGRGACRGRGRLPLFQ